MRCARENETAPVRQKSPGPVLFFLNHKPEYVPNTICRPGIYATFSGKNLVLSGVPFFLIEPPERGLIEKRVAVHPEPEPRPIVHAELLDRKYLAHGATSFSYPDDAPKWPQMQG